MYELLCLASHTSTLDPLLLYHTHVYMHLCFVSVQLLNWVIRLLSFSSVHSGVQIFTSHSIVFTPLLHMTQWFFAFLPITPPSAHFVFVSLYFHLLCSLPLFLLRKVNKTWVTTQTLFTVQTAPASFAGQTLTETVHINVYLAKRRAGDFPDRRGVRNTES